MAVVVGARGPNLDLRWRAYLRRFDIEHTFRFAKNTLGWTTPSLRTPEQADRWTWLVAAAYTQLRRARGLVDDLRLPWERPRDPAALTPTRARRGFRQLGAIIGTPASPPKSATPGPGPTDPHRVRIRRPTRDGRQVDAQLSQPDQAPTSSPRRDPNKGTGPSRVRYTSTVRGHRRRTPTWSDFVARRVVQRSLILRSVLEPPVARSKAPAAVTNRRRGFLGVGTRAPRASDTPISVVVIDLLSVSPYATAEFCKHLGQEGVHVSLAAATFSADPDCYRRYPIRQSCIIDVAARILPVRSKRRQLARSAEYVANLLVLLGQWTYKRPDIVHIQWLPLLEALPVEILWMRIVKALGIRIVYTVHNFSPHDDPTVERAKKFVTAYGLADHLVCYSEHVARSVSKLLEDRLVSISTQRTGAVCTSLSIPARVAAEDWLQTAFGIQKGPENRSVVLFCGTLRPYKGIEFLLDAWSMRARNANQLLVIAGDGDHNYVMDLQRRTDSLNRDDLVYIPRRLNWQDLVALHAASDVVVLPYRTISQSAALMFAARFDVAVIATTAGVFSEDLRDGKSALLVEYGDTLALTRSLDAIACSAELRERLAKGLANAYPDSRWRDAAVSTVAIYSSLLDSGAGHEGQ